MISPHAVIDESAVIADSVRVGPFSVIGPDVEIGEGCIIDSHVVIEGPTRIGRNNHLYSFSAIGGAPQDKKYAGEPTRLEIGDDNTIREYVTINRGTTDDQKTTRIGDDNWIMAYVHIAHDCQIGSHTIMANNATLAGHVHVEDFAILGGFSLIHQFCRIGAFSFTGMGTRINRDVPPYVTVGGKMSEPRGVNTEGLKRHGFEKTQIAAIRRAYRTLYLKGLPLEDALAQLQEMAAEDPKVASFVAFIRDSQRSILR